MGKGRAPCCDKSKVKTGPWSPSEDLKLINFIQKYGHSNWRALPRQAGLLRCGKSCRLRWINYLRPDVKRGNFTPEEEQTIINLHNSIGNKWSKIASYLPGRTDNEIKNMWNTYLKKRVKKNQDKKDQVINDSKIDYSASPSSTSSSITTSGEKSFSTSDYNVREFEVIEKQNNENLNQIETSNSPMCSIDNELGPYPKSEVIDPDFTDQVQQKDDGTLFEIPFEFDVDLWELLDSLDPMQSSDETHCGIEEKDRFGGHENEWLRLLEYELGLTSDDDHLSKGDNN